MKSRGMLFKSHLALKMQQRKKTQTRRPILPQPHFSAGIGLVWKGRAYGLSLNTTDPHQGAMWNLQENARCPHGTHGDRIWIRERHFLYGHWEKVWDKKLGREKWHFIAQKNHGVCYAENPPHIICKGRKGTGWHSRPGIFMPRWASRGEVEIRARRVQTLDQITAEDSLSEGMERRPGFPPESVKEVFFETWDDINGGRGLGVKKNPYLWALSFKWVKP